MQDINTEFDKEIRSILADAEEEVPSYLMDEVFSRLDRKREPVLPLWLKRTTAVMAAAAVLVTGFVLLFPEKEDITVVEKPVVTAEVREDSENQIAHSEELIADVVKPVRKISRPVVVNEIPVEESLPEVVQEDSVSEEPVELGQAEKPHEQVSNQEVEEETGKLSDYFDSIADEDEPKGRRKISMTVGGDLASNGNAKGYNGFGGFRAPGEGILEATYIEQVGKNSKYMIPLSFGFSTRIPFAKRWSAGIGLNYSMLQRTFTGVYTNIHEGKTTIVTSSDIKNTLHYVGIPVNVYYNIVDGTKVKFYAYAGGAVEKGISNVYRIGRSEGDIRYHESVKGVQASAGAGFGVEFMLADKLGLYVNPGLRYYFDCGQPVSIRTQQPLMMNFEIGFRVGI